MPELWELCNHESQVVLVQLYYDEQGCLPGFFNILEGKEPVKPVIDAPDYQELEEIKTDRFMREVPSRRYDC